ncbi:MAG: aminotransferase class I/II-fold pyridoxal phosphate-dependent enzyme [Candidatus Handelsmanbacteria bacterium]|nr:aminotransferase class I/II-fold pyridoxal phosphate-dependent enzyme [Candidatus Handelsmanbacteria bacterium]
MSEEQPFKGESTRAIHDGEERDKFARSLTNPIAQTATFVFTDLDEFADYKAGKLKHYEYGRYGNPTVHAAERKLAALEGGEEALLFPSGMSAVTSVLLAMLRQGQHVVFMEDCYRRTVQFCKLIQKFGVESTAVPPGDWKALEAAVRPSTRILFAESPTNPHLRVVDLERLVLFAKKRRLKVLIDSTFATPVNQRPLEYGVDLVIHSATKYLGGHNDLLAGSVCGGKDLVWAIKDFRNIIGSMVDPQSAYLLIRGLKTLGLRIERQNKTALSLARYVEEHPKIEKVYYPGLPSHPDHGVALRQLRGFGGVVSFEVAGDLERTRAFVHALRLPYLAPSLGGVESLVSHPATISYYDLSAEDRQAIGIKDQLVRYSVGIEDEGELIADLEQALAGV